jgi:hypothetical protein
MYANIENFFRFLTYFNIRTFELAHRLHTDRHSYYLQFEIVRVQGGVGGPFSGSVSMFVENCEVLALQQLFAATGGREGRWKESQNW